MQTNDTYLNFVRQPVGTAGPETGRRKSGGAQSGSLEDMDKLSTLRRIKLSAAAAASRLTALESTLSVESKDVSAAA